MNNPIWVMTSAFKDLNLEQVIQITKEIDPQGMEVGVFRSGGTRMVHCLASGGFWGIPIQYRWVGSLTGPERSDVPVVKRGQLT